MFIEQLIDAHGGASLGAQHFTDNAMLTHPGFYIDLFAVAILACIWYMISPYANYSVRYKRYRWLMMSCVLLLATDISTYFVPHENAGMVSMVVYCLAYMAYTPVIWASYKYFQVNMIGVYDFSFSNRIILGLCGVDIFLTLTSFYTGWFLYLSPEGVPTRGEGYIFHILLLSCCLFMVIRVILTHRNYMDSHRFIILLSFFVPSVIASIIIAVEGTNFVPLAIAYSVIMIFITLQSSELSTDFLTGALNRRAMETFVHELILRSEEDRTFGAIMIDLDKFKSINDTYGHDAGDMALRETVTLLKNSVRRRDLVVRLGGDEFLVVLETVRSIGDLEVVVQRIKNRNEHLNSTGKYPFKINFSIGYDLYDPASGNTFERFYKNLDNRMYSEKKDRRRS